jgi:hypothetical protein
VGKQRLNVSPNILLDEALDAVDPTKLRPFRHI